MPQFFSNYLKVVFVPEDLVENGKSICRTDCHIVQHFSYKSQRDHDTCTGLTLNNEDSTILDFTIKIEKPDSGKLLLLQIKSFERFSYSFIFNATFSPTGRLSDYDDALIAEGHIIDIEEEYSTATHQQRQDMMLMHVKLLLHSITFPGNNGTNNLVMKLM